MSKLTNMNTKMNTKITTMSKLANHYRQHRQHNQYSQYKRYKQYKLFLSLPLALLASFLINLMFTNTTQAATFTVTNTNDSGAGSLRQAIEDANSNANPGTQDVINFNIAGAGDHTIQPLASLDITQSVLINGYTQGDAQENTEAWPSAMDTIIRVGIDASTLTDAIVVRSNNVSLKGLAVTGASSTLIDVDQSDNFILEGSFIGVNQGGFDHYWGNFEQYAKGVVVNNSDNVRIGGTDEEDRNVIGRCVFSCISIQGSITHTTSDVIIVGNNIGIGIDSVVPLIANGISSPFPGSKGVSIGQYTQNVSVGDSASGTGNYLAHNNNGAIFATDTQDLNIAANYIIANERYHNGTVGASDGAGIALEGVVGAVVGGSSTSRNVISGNTEGALVVRNSLATSTASTDISIIDNYFGVMQDGITAFPNTVGQAAVLIDDDSADISIRENKIYNTDKNGISIMGTASKVSILQNSIYNNQQIGIDLNGDANHNSNDPSDADSGPNDMLNSPGYTSIVENAGNTEVDFSLDAPAGNYRIEFFSNTLPDASGIGEGETYLGFVNITHTGSGLEEFNHTLSGTGHTNLALTTTEIDPSTPSGFGASSEFGKEGQTLPDVSDISVRSVLQNPEDIANSNILDYEFTITNRGPDPADISTSTDAVPTSNMLLGGFLPPQVTFSSSSGDVNCVYAGDGSASMFGPLLSAHSNYGLVFCGYSGASPRILDPGDTFTFTIHAEVVDDSNQPFSIYGFSSGYIYNDPDASRIQNVYGSGNDIIDQFTQSYPVNNFSQATSTPADVEITKTLDNPQDVAIGNSLNYTLTFTNNGPSTLDPTILNGSGPNPLLTALFIDLLPPNLTYASQSNPDVNCFDAGTTSVLTGGSAFTSIPNHRMIVCMYIGADTSLANGEAISTTITATVGSVPSSFTNYVMGLGTADETERTQLLAVIISGGDTVTNLSSLNTNNFDSHTYTSSYDHDGDGIADQTEDSLAPNGDGNGDGIRDKLQSDVASAPNSITGAYTTLAVTGDCDTITNFEVVPESSLSVLDTQYNYPLGLKDFTLDCATPGGTANATIYYDKVYSEDSYQVRKLMNSIYSDLVDATIGTATVNGNQVTTISYSLKDGGAIDTDNATNSSITDPVGPGVLADTGSSIGDGIRNLVNTGVGVYVIIAIVLALLAGSSVLIYRNNRKGVR